jgi:transmembrane sensor
MSTGVPSDPTILEIAAQWCLRLENEVGDAVREEFHRWVLADSRHEEAYLAALSLTAAVADLPAQDRADLAASVSVAVPPVRGLPAAAASVQAPRRAWRQVALAASVLLAVVVAATFAFTSPSRLMAESFETATGETRTITFEDGSVAYLNTRTHVKWLGGVKERRVELVDGEALFDVAHDETRPFHVEVENSEIRVVGTRFNVYRKPSGEVIVTVLEGTIEVGQGSVRTTWKREVHAGQQIVYRPIGLVRNVHTTNALNAVKWRDGFLLVENEPLEDVLAELTRYTNRPITIRDPRIAQIPIGGLLSTRDVRAALRRLTALKPSIRVNEEDGQFILSQSPSTQQREEAQTQ